MVTDLTILQRFYEVFGAPFRAAIGQSLNAGEDTAELLKVAFLQG